MLSNANHRETPFASEYIDDSCDTPLVEGELETRWRDVCKELEDRCGDERIITEVAQAISHSEAGVGRRGRGVIATGDGVLINEHLPHPPRQAAVRVSDYPYLLPLLDKPWRDVYVFAAVDHRGADITLHHGATVRSETVDGGGYRCTSRSPPAGTDTATISGRRQRPSG